MRIHHLAFRCRDLEATRSFYEDVLGLQSVREQPGYSVWLALGDAVLMLEQAADDEPDVDPRSLRMVAFVLEDAPGDLTARLQDAGIPIEDRTAFTLYFRDPQGRRVGVSSYGLPELRENADFSGSERMC